MSTDTKIKTLIFNKLTQEQYNNADRVPTEFYLTPDTSIDSSEKGAANGVASLDTNGKVPTEQIPVATTSVLGGVKPDGNTITVTEDGTISAAISGEGVATKADLQYKVNKAGDTMSGTLKMSGDNHIRFGTDDSYYYIKKNQNGDFNIMKGGKGLFLAAADAVPHYAEGTNAYRLLTTADLTNIDYVVDSYHDASGNWYRKYKSGWVEQGGIAQSNGVSPITVSLLKPFANTTYWAFATLEQDSTSSVCGQKYKSSATTTSFQTYLQQGSGRWYASGQGAE